jgi:hypothetical protein
MERRPTVSGWVCACGESGWVPASTSVLAGLFAELDALRAVADAAEEVAFRETRESHNALVAALAEAGR